MNVMQVYYLFRMLVLFGINLERVIYLQIIIVFRLFILDILFPLFYTVFSRPPLLILLRNDLFWTPPFRCTHLALPSPSPLQTEN